MPRFSFIVSVHNSETFLPECLDSILAQSFDDFEVVAVDDASTDGSVEVLRHYAATDPRVRVIQLRKNLGAGGARNAALKEATGDYVWCLDSDDWIVPGALAAVERELEARGSEVLLFGWLRAYPDGSRVACSEQRVLEAAPRSFTLHEWPRAIEIHHMPWNKVVRRELVERTGFQFPEGWHQDLPFTYTMLSAARSISAVPKSLVIYRQHPDAATAKKDSGHLCVLDQWARMFDLVERHSPQPDLLRPHLINRMFWHLSEQLKKQDRLPMKDWPEFARRAQALWAARAPADYSFPRGATGLKYRLIAHHPALVPLVPRLFALRRALRRSVGLTRSWDLASRQTSLNRAHERPHPRLAARS
jgi:CDP-glycerol glycerophosphotransferase